MSLYGFPHNKYIFSNYRQVQAFFLQGKLQLFNSVSTLYPRELKLYGGVQFRSISGQNVITLPLYPTRHLCLFYI